jgi:hypothetical protein
LKTILSNPAINEEKYPNKRTGPASLKIFAAVPKMKPSLLNSIAGETTEFANPVIGTTVPAPPIFPN